jgi:hypothetical protein
MCRNVAAAVMVSIAVWVAGRRSGSVDMPMVNAPVAASGLHAMAHWDCTLPDGDDGITTYVSVHEITTIPPTRPYLQISYGRWDFTNYTILWPFNYPALVQYCGRPGDCGYVRKGGFVRFGRVKLGRFAEGTVELPDIQMRGRFLAQWNPRYSCELFRVVG